MQSLVSSRKDLFYTDTQPFKLYLSLLFQVFALVSIKQPTQGNRAEYNLHTSVSEKSPD